MRLPFTALLALASLLAPGVARAADLEALLAKPASITTEELPEVLKLLGFGAIPANLASGGVELTSGNFDEDPENERLVVVTTEAVSNGTLTIGRYAAVLDGGKVVFRDKLTESGPADRFEGSAEIRAAPVHDEKVMDIILSLTIAVRRGAGATTTLRNEQRIVTLQRGKPEVLLRHAHSAVGPWGEVKGRQILIKGRGIRLVEQPDATTLKVYTFDQASFSYKAQ